MPRTARTSDLMWQRLFRRFEGEATTLQSQLRDMVVHGVMEGFLQPGDALPSSRLLAQTLGLSRTTVSLALNALVDQGFLVARARSGIFVSEAASPPAGRTAPVEAHTLREAPPEDRWRIRMKLTPSTQRNIEKPTDWQQQPYPFVYGQFDATLFPFRDWRRCALDSLEARAVRRWAPDHIDRDHEALIEQVHARLLPARGIWVAREQILITSGAQQGLFLLAQLLMSEATEVGVETPGYPDARNNFALRTQRLRGLPVDDQGLVPGPELVGCDYVFVTPSHQCPTTVTLSMARRQALLAQAERDDFIVIEDDHESELNFAAQPTPALKSLDTAQRVIYLGSLSKTLAHGLRLGFIVAPVELIRELRALRRLVMRHVPSNNQQAAASFIAHGFHEAYVRRLVGAYRERARALRQALARHAPQLAPAASHGGSALWVSGPSGLDTQALARSLYREGVVVEPGAVFYAAHEQPCARMRIGYSSIALDRIDAGVQVLAQVLAAHLPKR